MPRKRRYLTTSSRWDSSQNTLLKLSTILADLTGITTTTRSEVNNLNLTTLANAIYRIIVIQILLGNLFHHKIVYVKYDVD